MSTIEIFSYSLLLLKHQHYNMPSLAPMRALASWRALRTDCVRGLDVNCRHACPLLPTYIESHSGHCIRLDAAAAPPYAASVQIHSTRPTKLCNAWEPCMTTPTPPHHGMTPALNGNTASF